MYPRSLLFTDPPLSPDRLVDSPPDRPASTDATTTVHTSITVAGTDTDVARTPEIPAPAATGGEPEPATVVDVTYRPHRLGTRARPPDIPGDLVRAPDADIVHRAEQALLERLDGRIENATPADLADLDAAIARDVAALPRTSTAAHAPDHLDIRSVPEALPPELNSTRLGGSTPTTSPEHIHPTTVFSPEDRQVLWDTAYPWGCAGRVTTGNGAGSGVMVGPRHLLTCSHVVVWNADGTCGWLDFVPGFFDRGPGPFGTARAVKWYAFRKVTGPTIDDDEARHDYCVLVLDWRIGDACGWLGTRSYVDGWDGSAWWTHVGYPADFGGLRPTWQRGISLDGDAATPDSNQRIDHWGDVAVGQSGGPFFGWWDDGPAAVAVQSGHSSTRNTASGGSFIPDLVNRARSEFP